MQALLFLSVFAEEGEGERGNSEFGIRNSEFRWIASQSFDLIVSRFARGLKGNVFAVDW